MNAATRFGFPFFFIWFALTLAPCRAAAGVALVRDINTVPVPANAYPQAIGTLGPNVLFNATDATGPALWTTSGTKAGTHLLHRFKGIGFAGGAGAYLPAGPRAYFVTTDGAGTSAVWVTNGTAAGTGQLIAFPTLTSASAYLFGFVGSHLLFSACDANGDPQLYAIEITAGVPGEVQRLTSFTGGINAGVLAGAGQFAIAGGKLFFVTIGAETPVGEYPRAIWASDGTAAGTHAVTSGLGDAVYNPQSFQPVGSLIFYTSDGSMFAIEPATEAIARIPAVQSVLSSQLFVSMGDYALYMQGTGPDVQLWRTDGTDAGTQRLLSIDGFSDISIYGPQLVRVGAKALFTGAAGSGSPELWSTDGTVANTVQLTHGSMPAYSGPVVLAVTGSTAYFYSPDGPTSLNAALWRTNGTIGSTELVADVPSFYIGNGGVIQIAGDSTQMYFGITLHLYDSTMNLYRYLPESNASSLVKSGIPFFSGDEFFFSNGQLFYSDNDPVIGDQPWVTNGTVAGTHLIEDLNPDVDTDSSNPDEFVELDGQLVFAADDGIIGRELWISNGTAAGTRRLDDINPGPASSNPNHLFTANGALYFFATDGTGKSKFMRLADIGAKVEDLATLSPQPTGAAGYCGWDGAAVIGTRIYFAANDGHSGLELWTSDGTPAGTHLTRDIAAGAADSYPCWLTALGEHVYFSAVGSLGDELWTSDGTEAGTIQVADIAPGAASSNPAGLLVFDNALYFDADDTVHGSQLWTSKGTAAGTHLVDAIDSPAGSYAYPIGAFNRKLLFQTFTESQNPIGFFTHLWTTSGTASGTAQLTPWSLPDTIATPYIDGSRVFFTGQVKSDFEPWVSDGTASGTHVLKDINPSGSANPLWFESFSGMTLFEVDNSTLGEQFWQTNGTTAGTTLLADIPAQDPNPSPVTSAVHRLVVGSDFFFAAHGTTVGTELYVLTEH